MPSNPPTSPSKRRAHRSASSSSLFPPVTTAHSRRPSRLPPSLSTSISSHNLPLSNPNHLIPMSSHSSSSSSLSQLTTRPSPPPHSSHPFSLSRLGAAVDALLRPPAKGKPRRPRDPLALLVLFSLFLTFFIALFLVLRSFFPSTAAYSAAFNARLVADNLSRTKRGLSPTQFWPLPDSRSRAIAPIPPPLAADVRIQHIWRARLFPPRSTTAFRQSTSPLRLSVVLACKDRTAFLQTILPRTLSLLHPTRDEVVLVDWASTPPDAVPLAEVVRATPDRRLSVISLTHPASWVLSRAYNLGFSLARGQFILKLDCDTLLHTSFFKQQSLSNLPDTAFYRFRWRAARNPNEIHLNGVFLARTAHIHAIHGYDERITTYGWDDSDLYARLEAGVKGVMSPLNAHEIEPGTLSHISHSDSLRAHDSREFGPLLQTQVNSQAVAQLSPWTEVASAQKTRFRLDLQSRDARFITATVMRTPAPILNQLSAEKRSVIEAEAVNRVLHDSFSLPWAIFSETNRARAHLLRALSAFARSSKWQPDTGVMFAELRGSIPNRIVALASVIAMARQYHRPLFVAWGTVDSTHARRNADEAPVKISDLFSINEDGGMTTADVPDTPFDISTDSSVVERTLHSSTPPVFVLGRWKCTTHLADCARDDPVYASMTEFRGERDTAAQEARAVLTALEGSGDNRRGVVLHLDGAFPGQARTSRDEVLAGLQLTSNIRKHVEEVGEVGDHVGLFLGKSIRARSVEALSRRMKGPGSNDEQIFFVSGENPEIVRLARQALPTGSRVAAAVSASEASDNGGSADEQVIRSVGREVAELAILARCKDMINDGRPPDSVLEIVEAWRQRKRSV